MAKNKPVFNHPFDTGAAMSVPLNMPGGRNLFWRLVGWGAALFLIVYAVFGRQLMGPYKELLISSVELNSTSPDPEATAAMFAQLSNFMWPALLLGLFAWLVMAMVETAMHKNIFRGTDHGLFPLRFGKDEARVMLAQLVLFICMMGVYFLAVLGIMLLIMLAAGLASISSGLGVVAGIASFFGAIYLFGFVIHACLRWAPASAMSVRDDKIRIFEGWTITKGRGWPLFGSYLVVGIVGYIIIYVIMIIGTYLAFGDMQAIAVLSGLPVDNPREAFAEMGEMLKSPKVMITLVAATILYVATLMVWYLCFWGVGNYMAQLDARERGGLN